MKTCAALLLAAGLAAACVSAGPAPYEVRTPTPSPPAAIPFLTPSPPSPPTSKPSPACGGFHLVVVNKSSGGVLVWINAERISEVAPEAMVEVIEMFWRPQLPPLPWDVQITRASDGAELLARHFGTGEDGAKLVLYDQNADLALGPCGSFG